MRISLDAAVSAHEAELVAVRRHLHEHPELGRAEYATTAFLRDRLEVSGLQPRVLPGGTGLLCDIGPANGPVVALRADLDALPLADEKDVSYRSTVPGVCHACGHDVHTTILLGAGLVLTELAKAGRLSGPVRLIFQPAEEMTPGGAVEVIAAGALDSVRSIFALHCDPKSEVGQVGLRPGAITSAADVIEVRLSGPGGHTARPQLTVDLVYALGRVVADVPGALSRLVDPRSGITLVWGMVEAGTAANAIPQSGVVRGTLRMLDHETWQDAPDLIHRLVEAAVSPYGAKAEVDYHRGVPPVTNDEACTTLFAAAVERELGPDAVVPTVQSLGGEDFAWYLESVPGAMARLGVRRGGANYDLHQGSFDIDERAIAVGVRVLVRTALSALGA